MSERKRRYIPRNMQTGAHPAIYPCWYCGHKDNHDATHARGCPKLPALTDAEVRAIGLACIRGWEHDRTHPPRRWRSSAAKASAA